MKKLLLAAFALVLCLSLVPAPVVEAGCPTLSCVLSPKSGPVGTKVGYTGSLTVTNSDYRLYWSSSEGDELCKGKTESGMGTEAYLIGGYFVIPKAPYGTHNIYIYASGPGAGPACPPVATFKVTPNMALKQTQAGPGDSVFLEATGFPASDVIEIIFDGTILGTVTSTFEGVFTNASFVVPKTSSGKHAISVNSTKLDPKDAPAFDFAVTPKLTVTNPAPTIGSEVKILGDGFAPRSEVSIKYDDTIIKPKEEKIATDDKGSFSATIVIPNSPKATHSLDAVDATGGSASASGNVASMTMGLEKDPPPTPSIVYPLDQRFGIYGSQVVSFKWTDVKDPSGVAYTMEIGKDLTFFPPVLRKKGIDKTEYTLMPVEALSDGTYYWRVKAVDGAGNEGQWSVAPYPVKIGLIPLWGFVIAGILGLLLLIIILRTIIRFVAQLFRY